MPLTRKIARNILRQKHGNKGLNTAWYRYQNRAENHRQRRGQNYSERDINKIREIGGI